jgi:hypothetical protein
VNKRRPVLKKGDEASKMWRVRRVVTATDEDGKSYLLSDDIAGNYKEMAGMDGLFLTDLWETNGQRANNKGRRHNSADR